MIFSFFKTRRRRRTLAKSFPDAWRDIIHEHVPYYHALNETEQQTLRDIVQVMMSEKTFEPCNGFELNDTVKLAILAQAAILILHLDHDYYKRVRSILVYPNTFVVEDGTPVLGLAALNGPVVLAWNSVQGGAGITTDGHNLVFHEFAHKLDMLDRVADGTPPLRDRAQLNQWVRIMTDEYQQLCELTSKRRRSVLRKYGATNPAEFFAVATECFFEKPRQMQKRHAELYDLLRDYYTHDPAHWKM